MPEKLSNRFDELARLAATSGVNRRQLLNATGAAFLASVFLGGKHVNALASVFAGHPLPPQEECNHPVVGQACFGACFATMAVCTAECVSTLGLKCVACMGGVESGV